MSSSNPIPATPRVYVAIALCSGAVLMQEVLLTRVFSFTIWYHLAYLTISTALLGFGAAGSLLAAFPAIMRVGGRRVAAWGAVCAALSLLFAIYLLGPRPLDPLNLISEPGAFTLGLFAYYVTVTIPFLFAGVSVVAPLRAYPLDVNRLYAADLFGAGLGCLGAVLALKVTSAAVALTVCALMFILGALLYADKKAWSFAYAAGAVVLLAAAPAYVHFVHFVPAPSKAMGIHIRQPGTEILYTQWSPVNRVDLYSMKNPYLTFWAGVGRGKGYKGPLPKGLSLQYDAHNGTALYSMDDPDAFKLLDHHLLRLPYVIKKSPDVMVVGVGGGIDIVNAFHHGAHSVTGVELQPITTKLLTQNEMVRKWTHDFFLRPDLTLIADEGRHYIRSHSQTYDLIQQTATDTFSAQSTGAYVLAESYLYTVEAMRDYLSRLKEDGLITIVLGDLFQKGETGPAPLVTRLALAAREAVEQSGASHPESHIIVISDEQEQVVTNGTWAAPESFRSTPARQTVHIVHSLLVKKSPFTNEEIKAIRAYACDSGFQVTAGPDNADSTPLAQLLHADSKDRDTLLAAQPYHLKPVTDDTPFFFHVLPWTSILTGERTVWNFPGSTTGQLILLIMLAQALILGSVLILVPLGQRVRRGVLSTRVAFGSTLYFIGLGVGFMLIEISFVQKYVLLLGYPTYSLSITIFSLLIFAALGAYLCPRFWKRMPRFFIALLAVTVAFILAEVAVLPVVRESFLAASLPVRILVTVLLQLPLGVCLGMYFPSGVEMLRGYSPELIPWAWAVNGVASVVSLVLAVILGMSIGFSGVALVAAGVYIVGTVSLLAAVRNARQSDTALGH